MAGVDTHRRELAVKSAVELVRAHAARFLIDVGGVGGSVLLVAVHRQMADAVTSLSTPAALILVQRTAPNTIQVMTIGEAGMSEMARNSTRHHPESLMKYPG